MADQTGLPRLRARAKQKRPHGAGTQDVQALLERAAESSKARRSREFGLDSVRSISKKLDKAKAKAKIRRSVPN